MIDMIDMILRSRNHVYHMLNANLRCHSVAALRNDTEDWPVYGMSGHVTII